jgi:hypothetical protein
MSSEAEWRTPHPVTNPGVTELGIRLAIWASWLPHPPAPDEIAAAFPDVPVRFALWALQLRRLPTTSEIQARFPVCRTTAYRYRTEFARALAELAQDG